MTQLKYTGGAKIGMSNVTWPFASLTVTKDRLDLNAAIVGKYSFTSEDIISIEPYSGIINRGLKIIHKVPKYKDKIIFWTFKNPQAIINDIRNLGFFDGKSSSVSHEIRNEVSKKQKQGGFPVKTSFAIAVVVIWNILFLTDFTGFFKGESEDFPLGNGAIAALGFVLITCVLTLVSKDFRKLVLKESRELKDISTFLYFIMLLCGFLLIGILTIPKI